MLFSFLLQCKFFLSASDSRQALKCRKNPTSSGISILRAFPLIEAFRNRSNGTRIMTAFRRTAVWFPRPPPYLLRLYREDGYRAASDLHKHGTQSRKPCFRNESGRPVDCVSTWLPRCPRPGRRLRRRRARGGGHRGGGRGYSVESWN